MDRVETSGTQTVQDLLAEDRARLNELDTQIAALANALHNPCARDNNSNCMFLPNGQHAYRYNSHYGLTTHTVEYERAAELMRALQLERWALYSIVRQEKYRQARDAVSGI